MGDKPKGSGGSGRRSLKVHVKTAKRRRASSTRWLERQLNDPYVARAQAEGYRARSAYKLIEMDDRYHLLGQGKRVVDLGAAPGGWLQVVVAKVHSTAERPLVVGIDYLDIDPVPGVTILKQDFLDPGAPDAIRAALGAPADLVLSDMAAPTTGHRQTDHFRTVALSEAAAEFATSILRPGGDFVVKVFRGGAEGELLARLKREFATVHHVKPPASRAASVELYVVAKGFRGTA
jgi:23S rRNA (uridine2552-2'-O)-methyltransferase